MASDSFTNTNGTALADHAAGGNTWAPMVFATVQGEINSNRVDSGAGFNVSARASNSTSHFSQIVLKAGNYSADKGVNVGGSASSYGYSISPGDLTGDVFASLILRKDGGFVDLATVSMDRTVDHTLAIKRTIVGSDVHIEGWLDGVQLTWSFDTPTTTYVDPAANSPITGGNPGFSYEFNDDFTQANSAFDDWTDVEPSAAATLSAPTPSGTIGTQTTATIGATTDQSTGNFYAVVDSPANLAGVTATQIKAGLRADGNAALASGDSAVSTTSPSVGVTGLVASTGYAYAAIQNNANGDSNIVTGTFTTAAAGPASAGGGNRNVRARVATMMLT